MNMQSPTGPEQKWLMQMLSVDCPSLSNQWTCPSRETCSSCLNAQHITSSCSPDPVVDEQGPSSVKGAGECPLWLADSYGGCHGPLPDQSTRTKCTRWMSAVGKPCSRATSGKGAGDQIASRMPSWNLLNETAGKRVCLVARDGR